MNDILLDSSFVTALNNPRDKYHTSAAEFVAANKDASYLLPDVVLPEAAFLLHRAGGSLAVRLFVNRIIASGARLQGLERSDLETARDIMAQYADAKLDFVDCCLMALSERLLITQVCTFDRRDFSLFRPRHVSHLELLP